MTRQHAIDTALLVVQQTIALVSSVSSLMIISQVTRSKFNRSMPQQRLILCISICDIILGLCWIFNPLLMYNDGSPYWARGNQISCSFQGFMIQLFLGASVLYQASLQIQYLLGIKYGWTQRRLRNIEIYLHIVPIGLALASAITNLVLKNYNSAGWHCWIATLPSNCTSSYELTNGEVTDCIRGDNASLYQWGFFYVPLWLVINFCLYAMYQIYNHVYECESRTVRYQFSVDAQMKMTKEVKSQSCLYFLAFFVTYSVPSLTRMFQLVGIDDDEIMSVISSGTLASMGLWNALIYFRPRYKKLDEEKSALRKVASLINATLFFWVSCSDVRRRKYVADTKDVVTFAEIGDGKAMEMGDDEDTDIALPIEPRNLARATYAGYSLMFNREGGNERLTI